MIIWFRYLAISLSIHRLNKTKSPTAAGNIQEQKEKDKNKQKQSGNKNETKRSIQITQVNKHEQTIKQSKLELL